MDTRSPENLWVLDSGREHGNGASLEPQCRTQQAAMTGREGAFPAQAEQQEQTVVASLTMTLAEAAALALRAKCL